MLGTSPAARSAAKTRSASWPWPFSAVSGSGYGSGYRIRIGYGSGYGLRIGYASGCDLGYGLGYGLAQQVRERGAEPERGHRQAGHEHDDRPRRPGRASGGQQVIDDLAEHAERQGADRRAAGERAGPLRRARCQPGAERVGAVRLDADRQRDRGVEPQAVHDARAAGAPRRTRTCRRAPTHPDQTATAAGAAITNSGQRGSWRPALTGPPRGVR